MFHATNFTETTASYEALDDLMEMSNSITEFVRQNAGTDQAAIDNLISQSMNQQYLDRRGLTIEDMPAEGFINQEHMAVWTMFASRAHWFARWGELAFPRIQTSHSFAAKLLATTVSRKEIPFIEAPWPAFLLEIPEGLLPIATKDGTMSHVTRVLVNTSFLPTMWGGETWWSLEFTGKGIEIHRAGRIEESFDLSTAKELKEAVPLIQLPDSFGLQEKDLALEDPEDVWTGYNRSQEERVCLLATRLVLGACILMTDKAKFREREVRLQPRLANLRKRLGKEPVARVFTIGQPVKIDFRPVVEDYLTGGLRSLCVQSLVAGHHKYQPHGPSNTLRKWIFVEPYWRGDVEDLILVRPHVGAEDG